MAILKAISMTSNLQAQALPRAIRLFLSKKVLHLSTYTIYERSQFSILALKNNNKVITDDNG
jgi:hypothetical protein